MIENNTITNNKGDGGVEVLAGTGNHITHNVMRHNAVAINLGGGDYRYNALNFFDSGPNHYQPYPELLDVSKQHATVTVTAQLSAGPPHRHDSYTIDLYAQASPCDLDSVRPGDAEKWLGSTNVHTDGHGDATFDITVPRSQVLSQTPVHRAGDARPDGDRHRGGWEHLGAQPLPDARPQSTELPEERRHANLDHARGHHGQRHAGARRASRSQRQDGQARASAGATPPVLPADHDPPMRRIIRAADDRGTSPRDRPEDVHARPRSSLEHQRHHPPQRAGQAQARPSTPDALGGQHPRRRQTGTPQHTATTTTTITLISARAVS